jgi:predicted TIM-barrel fold metal-dependent hydrolase
MADKEGRTIIALEEHYWDREVAEHFEGRIGRAPALQERLFDLGQLRLREMDESGIDIQVISHGAPALQRLNPELAVELAVKANNGLRDACAAHPDRFAGFAMLPIPDPAASADELERCVDKLGFKGAMVHGITGAGGFLDDKKYWPIYERAQALDVPIYLHPAPVHDAVLKAYYGDYVGDFPNLATSAWGWTVETATMAIRMVLSGVFDAYPDLKIILGHMGESIPFSLVRIDESLSRAGNKALEFRKTFVDHFWITTSGNFSTPALLCSLMEMGADRILFSIDYPFVLNPPGPKWFETVPLGDEDKAKVLGGNAKKLLKL